VVHALKYLVWERRCEPDNVGLIRQLETKSYRPALQLIESLLKELRKLDDKMILTEVHLLESRVNHATKNMPKAKVRSFFLHLCTQSALTSARTAAASIYCPPLLQAQLDSQSGTLNTEDRDYKTG
jgi:26S proteasome regulatory subunit N6